MTLHAGELCGVYFSIKCGSQSYSITLLEGCLKFNISNFIFSSSCSVYGNISKLPVNEDTPFSIAESPYAYTKQVGETIIKDYAKKFDGLKTISLRYFNPVGAHVSGLIGESPINPPTSLLPIITQTAIGLREKYDPVTCIIFSE